MATTSQLTNFSELYTDLGNRLRVSVSHAETVVQLKRYINIALHDMHLGFEYKFPWCERQSYLRTKAPYTDGTVTATKGSVTLTGSSTLWNTNNSFAEKPLQTQGKIIIAGSQDVYKINAVSSDTSATIYTHFIGDTVSGSDYTYFEDEYGLISLFLRPVDYRMFSPLMGIALITRQEFRRRYPVVNVAGKPRVACIIDSDTTGSSYANTRRVVFYPYPDQVYNIPYTYITSTIAVTSAGAPLTSMSSDSDEPVMPLRYRHAIVFHALYHWYRDKKDDTRSEAAKADYTDIMQRIIGDHDIATHTQARLAPRMGMYNIAAKRPYSTRAGRIYDLNDEFDSFRR